MAIVESTAPIAAHDSLEQEATRLLAPLHALRRSLVLRATGASLLSILMVVVIGALFVMGLDLLVRWRTPAPRWIGAGAVIAATLAAIVRALYRRSWSFSLRGLAARLEVVFPELQGELTSAVAIADAPNDDPLAGSSRLRSRLMRRATILLSEIDLSRAIHTPGARLQLFLLGAVIVAIVTWAIAAPSSLWQAGRRLAAPWRIDAWPRLVILELDAPAKLARGNAVRLVVRSKTSHQAPAVKLYVADDEGKIWTQPMHHEENRFVLSLPKVTQSIWLRATGGDDDQMRWKRLEIVEPVVLTATKLVVTPPAYAQLPPEKVGGDIVALEGSTLAMEFRSSRAIREARSFLNEKPAAVLAIDASGRKSSGEVALLATSGKEELRIDVRDRDGATATGAWRGTVKVLRDLPPVIEWRDAKLIGKIHPQSRPSLAARVSDDIRLVSLQLRQRVVTSDGNRPAADVTWQELEAFAMEEGAKEKTVIRQMDLSGVALMPGDQVEWQLVATDAKGQVKESEVLKSMVVSSDDLRKDLDRRFERLLEQLAQAARRQRELVNSLEGVKNVESGDVYGAKRIATLRAAQFDEHALIEGFQGKGGGILDTWRRLTEEEQLHQLLRAEDQSVVEEVSSALDEIATEQLPSVSRELERLQTQLESAAPPADSEVNLGDAIDLATTASNQLDDVVDRLAHWRRWSRAAQTLGELLDAQQKLLDKTRDATPQLLGRLPEELDEAETKLLEDLANQQQELTRQLAELPPPPGSQSQTWRNARATADEQMRLSARDLALNQLSQASSHQDQAIGAMQELSKASGAVAEGNAGTTSEAEKGEGAADRTPSGPTEAQLREVIGKQSELREKTGQTLESLKKPGANRPELEAELKRLSEAQAELARQVEAWQAASEPTNMEKPHE